MSNELLLEGFPGFSVQIPERASTLLTRQFLSAAYSWAVQQDEMARAEHAPKMMSNQDSLRELMTEHRLTYRALADLAGWSVETVRAKLKPQTSRGHRRLTDRDLEYIRLKLAGKQPRT